MASASHHQADQRSAGNVFEWNDVLFADNVISESAFRTLQCQPVDIHICLCAECIAYAADNGMTA
ncbi:hypothetical protein XspCFBP7912_00325 [Xanthomonas sp. CFBP 7912]|nr:hypothetical protein XspCFBP7912_00325 [Xanthomonas sp. CFBP 7912]RJS03998.1 hypothetical protein XnspCFBP7698_12940 [Xanthomonas sp. CFBP 7698]